MASTLFLCATPIGNLADASPRLRTTLEEVDVVYAEDTRRTRKLLEHLGVVADLRSYFVGNERRRTDELEADLISGKDVAVVTDAGMPGISDPGQAAVAAARRVGSRVVVIPGPSAVTAVAAGSGMVEGRFVFEGFLERRGRARSDQLEAIAGDTRPSVVFLSPHRVVSDLAALAEVCGGDREVCVGRELTKLHEELWWGTLDEAVNRWGEEAPRGEFTIVVSGAPHRPPDDETALEMARALMDQGLTASQAARQAAAATGASRREIYDELVK